ncbi:SDR family oxidoreductase [Bacillus sp. FJAT-49705]|uniref:SDR family oxidoreductase n=1 Tax=Cytobacillus citreus TaxID=2833586 RepID=A0ABS5NYB0_9BACI|nr:SDR family oxidoreductase [Cytobacillus citreus]
MTENVKTPRVWFITGASSGLGLEFVNAALETGDRVVAVARNIEKINEMYREYPETLLPLKLDVTNRGAVFSTVATAIEHFGKLDIVINNAGNMVLGMIEEQSEEEARSQLETNFFGALWVCQAVMPHLREQSSGHIIQISSIGGLVSGPMAGVYSASKFALEGMSEALAQEAAHFGVKLTIAEPGGYWTNLYLKMRTSQPMDAYDPLRNELAQQNSEGSVDSDPRLAAEAILKLANSENPPLRLILGSVVYDIAIDSAKKRIDVWKQWEEVSRAAEKAIPAPEGYGEMEN